MPPAPDPGRPPPGVRPAWWRRRLALHAAYERCTGLVDASRMAFVCGTPIEPEETELAGLWREQPADPRARNHVYVHVPFCKSICHFCNYERLRPSSPDLLTRWLDRVARSVATLAPAVAHLAFHSLYVGGGTPSVLPAPLLARLLEILEALPFREDAWRGFEFDPAVMRPDRLELLHSAGFRHFSFGIQTLDPDVNEAHGRGPQDPELVWRRFDELAALGIEDVGCDVLMGLAGTTPEDIERDISRILERGRPLTLDVFELTPTRAYLDRHFGGKADAFWAHLAGFERHLAPRLPALARRHGYAVREGSGHRWVLTRPREHTVAEGPWCYTQVACDQRAPLNLLGLGPSARSQLWARAHLQAREPPGGAEGPFRYTGRSVGLVEEAAIYALFHLRDAERLPREETRRVFGREPEALYGPAIAAWSWLGLGGADEEGVVLAARGRQARHRALMWLAPEAALEAEVAAHRGWDLSPRGMARRLGPLRPGSELPGGWRVGAFGHARVELVRGERRATLRLCPPLVAGDRARWVLEDGPTAGPALRRAAAALSAIAGRGRSARNPW